MFTPTILIAAAASLAASPPRAQIDHIVVGISDLDRGIVAFEQITGVTAARGGRHPARGTENALVSLGGGRYLELIAAGRDAAPTPDLQRLRSLSDLTVIGWAVHVSDMAQARHAMASAGVTLGEDKPGSRVTPSGTTLEWTTADISSPEIAGAPFLINWSTATEHPSTTSPTGCALLALEVQDPAAADLSRALNALRVSGVTVRRGEPRMAVRLKCPRGAVVLSGR